MSSPAGSRDIPPPLELECLRALWGLGEASVGDVRKKIHDGGRELAYTTVMTALDRLEKRGGVTRRKQGRFFIYTPKLSREFLRRLAVKDLVDRLFDGSEQVLLAYLESTSRVP
jgi:BlaI family penicillinase repressor